MTKQQLFAVRFFMSGYPEGVTDFDEMLKVIAAADDTTWDDLETDDDMPIVWEPFEHYSSYIVAKMVSEMVDSLNAFFPNNEANHGK
jgi:hypothetical protein